MLDSRLQRAAVTSVVLLITFLSFGTQIQLLHGHLTPFQYYAFNILISCTIITYTRSILSSAGSPPRSYTPSVPPSADDAESGSAAPEHRTLIGCAATRWCRPCESFKPPRAHHCKTCGVCTLRMDHHCPWTANCIGFANLPHFLRFVGYSSAAVGYLCILLTQRWLEVYRARDLPAYMGPHTLSEMVVLGVASVVVVPLEIALAVLGLRTMFNVAEGYTTIETWEKERHDAGVRRGRVRRVVFPYDVGIWENLAAAMGYVYNPILWLNPLAASPVVGEMTQLTGGKGEFRMGLEYEVNGFESPEVTWPPADDREVGVSEGNRGTRSPWTVEGVGNLKAFRKRQRADAKRRGLKKPYGFVHSDNESSDEDEDGEEEVPPGDGTGVGVNPPFKGRTEWKNAEGERLADFGVDEDAEAEDEDVPLAVLKQRLIEREAKKEK